MASIDSAPLVEGVTQSGVPLKARRNVCTHSISVRIIVIEP